MENRKSTERSIPARPISGSERSDLLHHVDAISRALKNWNDIEALKLLRLHWPEISCALRRPELPKGIPVVIPHSRTAYEVIEPSPAEDVHLTVVSARTAS
jgi:hypothetical protein